jgi:hypothetical protein
VISFEMGLSTGAIGMAWAETVIRPRPMANADAASSFIDVSFSSRFAAMRHNILRKQHSGPITPKRFGLTSGGDASDAGANPNDADPNACDGPNGPLQASDDRRRPASLPLIPGFRHARA